MTVAEDDDAARLRGTPPTTWADARAEAARLARQLQYLTWPDRAKVLDEFLWRQARTMLSSDEVTSVINRQSPMHPQAARVAEYSRYCGAVATSVLFALAERQPVSDEPHALSLLLSEKAEHREAAIQWIGAAASAALAPRLATLPGYAFYFLTLYPNDSAESFMARDAFWAAMLGRS